MKPNDTRDDAAGRALRPVDKSVAAYLLLSGAVFLLPARPPSAPVLVGAHILVLAMLLRVPPFRRPMLDLSIRWPGVADFLAQWYPLLLIPILYKELDLLTPIVWGGHFFDGPIQALEEAVFRSRPSSDLALAFPNLVLSELLHLSYLSYYLIIFGPPVVLYVQRRRGAFQKVVLGVMLTFFAHYLFFIFFPVEGPFFRGESFLTGHVRGPIQGFALSLSSAGATRGATFPSSHVGVAVAQATLSYYYLPRWFPALLVGALGVTVGAVYCGYHYGVDSGAGVILGWSVAYAVARTDRSVPRRRNVASPHKEAVRG